MITLCMDTSHKYLAVGLLKEDGVLDGVMKLCWKKQSETILPEIDQMIQRNGLKPKDIDQIVISIGPGSFTGVRIAMTIAKVLAATAKIPLFAISTLRLYAGPVPSMVVLDARGGRCYCGLYDENQSEEQVLPLESAKALLKDNMRTVGDMSILGGEDVYPDINDNFFLLRDAWRRVENVHGLKPIYLKAKDEYKPNI